MVFNHAGRDRRISTEGARSRSSRSPAGSSTTRRRSGHNTREVIGDRARRSAGITRQRDRRRRDHQPARDHPLWDRAHRQARLQRDRLAGHAHAADIVDRLSRATAARTASASQGRPSAGAPTSPARRCVWMLEHVDGARARAEAGDLLFGNMDTWLLWNLTGGTAGGVHVTDVTNASRTLLMDLRDARLGRRHRSPRSAFRPPCSRRSRSPREVYGDVEASRPRAECPIAGILGDQQAALFGQTCFDAGEAKNTYGTGNFLLMNTGEDARPLHGRPPHHPRLQARRASRPSTRSRARSPITGALVQWLRDNLGLIIDRAPRSNRSPRPSRTTAAPTSSRPSRASTRRTGGRTRAA